MASVGLASIGEYKIACLPINDDVRDECPRRETHACVLHCGSLRVAQNHVRKVRQTRRSDAPLIVNLFPHVL